MEQNNINTVMALLGDKIPAENVAEVQALLQNADDDKVAMLTALPLKSPMVMLIIAWFVGSFGVDRFMLGKTGQGVAKLLTVGGCGIWAIINLFTVMGETKQFNLEKVKEVLA